MDSTKTTIDHELIKAWAEKYKGRPQVLEDSATHEALGLRIDFPGPMDDAFLADDRRPRNIPWKEFFVHFDTMELAFEYREALSEDDASNAYHFLPRSRIDKKSLVQN